MLIIIVMYIYHVLINTVSTHMIHINLNAIFYAHTNTIFNTNVEHVQSYQNNLHFIRCVLKHTHTYTYTHTHTHTHIHMIYMPEV